MATATPAQAVDSYTPHGGTVIASSDDGVAFDFVEAGQTFTCDQFDLAGTVTNPGVSRPFTETTTTWDQHASSGCFNPIMGDTTFEPSGAWAFAITGPEVGSVSPATFNYSGIFVEMANCSLDLTGEVLGEFDDTTGVFTPTVSTLTIADDPAGFFCPVLGFERGQAVTVFGSWTISGLTITNP